MDTSLAVALALVAAEAALGVAALRRARLGLTPIETIAFGAPLGAVVASLLLIPLATMFGLTAATVIGLGAGCAVGAVWIWPPAERARLRAWVDRHAPAGADPSLPLIAGVRPAPARSVVQPLATPASEAEPDAESDVAADARRGPISLPRALAAAIVRFGPWPALILALLGLRWVLVFQGAQEVDATGLWAGHEFIWSDWSTHVGDLTSFAWGGNFPPENPRLPGLPYSYHFLTALTAAQFVPMGIAPWTALELGSLVFSLALGLAVFGFARRLIGSGNAAALALLLFLLGGSLGWLATAAEMDRTGDPLGVVLDGNAWNYGELTRGKFNAGIPAVLRFASERGYTLGLPLALLTLTLLYLGVQAPPGGLTRRLFVAAGLSAGLMPLVHLSSMLALALITPVLLLLFPRREWVLAGVVAAAVAAPQLLWLVGSGGGAAESIRWQVGWVAAPDPWWWFWLKNLGLIAPLLVMALLDRRLLVGPARRFLWAFMPIFVLANLLVFQPWDGDNTKVLFYWYLGATILVAALLARLWRVAGAPVVRCAIVVAVLVVIANGLLATADQLRGHDRFLLLNAEELRVAELVRAQTPADAVFVIGLQGNHPVSMLTGRRVVMSFPGWAWAYGIADPEREQAIRDVYRLEPETPELLRRYGADYVVVGPWEQRHLDANPEAFRAHFPVLLETESYAVFDVRAATAGLAAPIVTETTDIAAGTRSLGDRAADVAPWAGAVALLAALGAFGIALLRRADLALAPLEIAAYGFPLGAVLGSLALLVCAVVFALTAWTVAVVAVASLLGAVVLSARVLTPAFPPDVPVAEVDDEGAADRAAAPARSGWRERFGAVTGSTSLGVAAVPVAVAGVPEGLDLGRVVAVIRRRVGLFPLLVFVALTLRWALLWTSALDYDPAGLWAGHLYIWGDWSQHLGDVAAFAWGDNVPAEHPRFAGVSYAYHFLGSLTAAAMVEWGLDPAAALTFHAFVFSLVVALCVFAFARRLTRDRDAAALTVALFLLGGGLGWLLVVGGLNGQTDVWQALRDRPWDVGEQMAANFRWQNVYFTSLMPQRAYLYGLPLSLLVLTLLYEAVQRRRTRWFVAAGAVAGLLPFAHLGPLPLLALLCATLFVIFPGRGWLAFGAVWAAVAAPQLLAMGALDGGEATTLRWDVGWLNGSDPAWWFWLKNLGLIVPLLVVALLDRRLVSPVARRFLWAFMPVALIANLVVFQPDPWDNVKLLIYAFLAASVLVAALLIGAWRTYPTLAVRALLVGVVGSMMLSGVLQNLHQAEGKDRYLLLTAEEIALAERVRAETPADAMIAVGLQSNHPIVLLGGRSVVMSYPGWLWPRGLDPAPRERDLRTLYALAPAADAIIQTYGIDYVVVGPWERANFAADPAAWRARFPVVIETGNYLVFYVVAP